MDEARARELLERERARIDRALAERDTPGDREDLADYDQHLGDAASELYQSEHDAGLAEQLGEELAAVERAEQRLAEGTYGLSVDSGEPIPDERLEALPTAERTVEEQSRRPR